jgi:hypothetical protein
MFNHRNELQTLSSNFEGYGKRLAQMRRRRSAFVHDETKSQYIALLLKRHVEL